MFDASFLQKVTLHFFRFEVVACGAPHSGLLWCPTLLARRSAVAQLCMRAGHLRQVIIAGARGAPDMEALLDAAAAAYAPDKALIAIDPADEPDLAFWREHNPEALATVEGAGAPHCPSLSAQRAMWAIRAVHWPCSTECACTLSCLRSYELQPHDYGHSALPVDCCHQPRPEVQQRKQRDSSPLRYSRYLLLQSGSHGCTILCTLIRRVLCCNVAGLGPGSPATAFVCQNFTCKAPTRDPAKLTAALREGRSAPQAKAVLQPVDLSGLTKR